MTTYQLDGVDLDPQPVEHEWDHPNLLGHDGNGAPIYGKYSAITLRCPIEINKHDWWQYVGTSVVSSYSLYAPAPGSVNDFTTYTGVYVESVREGVVSRKSGMRGVEMVIIGIEV